MDTYKNNFSIFYLYHPQFTRRLRRVPLIVAAYISGSLIMAEYRLHLRLFEWFFEFSFGAVTAE